MDIKELQRNWELFGKTDPLRAILTGPPTPDGWNDDDFFRTGRQDIDAAFERLERLGKSPRRGRALDFGCGVGRLTQALCERFDTVVGVDIAPAMIELARRYNRFGDRCQYVVNDRDDLSRFPDGTFDFVYSLIVLQHMKPKYSQRYLKEFLRVAAPGGIIVFQIPAALKAGNTLKLPSAAFRAHLEPIDAIESLHAGERRTIAVRVTNRSSEPWTERAGGQALALNLGNHWLGASGAVVALDDGRTPVPAPVRPGETVQLDLLVTAPSVPGKYFLELDLVQEGVSWFGRRGSPTCRCPVEVRSTAGVVEPSNEAGAEELLPKMEMYWVPRASVERLVRENGGAVLGAYDHHGAGPAFENYQYFVARRSQDAPLRGWLDSARSGLQSIRSRLRR